MQIVLPDDLDIPATLILGNRLTEDAYFAFCSENPDINIELTSAGEIVILPWVGGESAFRITEAGMELGEWARRDGRGRPFGPSVQFLLPDGSGLSPDAAWVSKERLATRSKSELQHFPHLAPEFVIEVMGQTDRLAAAQKKMRLWAANGVELGWLIDGDNRSVHVYRGSGELRVITNAESIAGEGPVDGFILPLGEIWAGL